MPQTLIDLLTLFKSGRESVIPILQKVQEKEGYISTEAIPEIAKFCKLPPSEVFGVASFYAQFRFTRPGRHNLKVCLGTACHVRGGELIMESVERDLDTTRGCTSKDNRFSLERVACFGSCALAPVIVIDKDVYGRMTTTKVKDILDKYQ